MIGNTNYNMSFYTNRYTAYELVVIENELMNKIVLKISFCHIKITADMIQNFF